MPESNQTHRSEGAQDRRAGDDRCSPDAPAPRRFTATPVQITRSDTTKRLAGDSVGVKKRGTG